MALAAERFHAAGQKARSQRTETDCQAMTFASLVAHLGTLYKHEVTPYVGKVQEGFAVLGGKPEAQALASQL